jgi:acetyl coenzyme A synthetase (ADP forming)-like protein
VLDALFYPRSIAVIGASNDPQKVGYAVLANLIKFRYKGVLAAINPRAESILGIEACPSVLAFPGPIDHAIIAIPPAAVPHALQECASKGISAAVIITAGFKEAGAAGTQLEDELKTIAKDNGIRILGPNCLGIINTANDMNATFAAGMLPKGKLSFFSQSGALGIAILDWAIGNKIGFSKFISLGNKADLNETDFIEYFADDPETDIILGYIEDVVDGKRFLEVAKRVSKIKPIILVKAGGTEAGARAASSHTGALAGSENAFNAAFRQTGIIRAEGIEDLFETAKAFYSKKIPAGNNLLIITNAGGPGIIAADKAERLGINLPQLSKGTIESLAPLLPGNASLYNPVDIIGDASAARYSVVLEKAITDPVPDGFLVILTPQAVLDVEGTARAVIRCEQKTVKPFITSFMGEERVRTSIEMLKEASIPNFPYPEPAVHAFRKLYDYGVWRKKVDSSPPEMPVQTQTAGNIIADAQRRGQIQFAEDSSREVLASYGFRFPAKRLAQTPHDAVRAASVLGFPVVMKISSPDILHKTDIGGVKVGLRSAKEVKEAFTEITLNAHRLMPTAFINGVSVCEMVPAGREVILGVTFDRTFGHMVVFGLGGIYVEVLRDVAFRIAPVGPADAEEMVREIRSFPLLQGARGEKAVDLDSIISGILRLSRLVTDFPQIQELDINPLVVNDRGAVALDARIIITREGGGR